ncbi:MAG: hypothetical protein AAGB97_08545 [Dehalococcoidia bacterium]
MKLREVTSKLVFPSALVAIGSYIFIVFISWWYIGREPPDALLDLFLPAVIVCVLSSAGAAYTLGVNMKCPRIRIAAAVLGVLGGVMSALIMPIPWFAVEQTLASLMAIGGGIFALRRPGVGGILMLLGTTIATIAVWRIFGIVTIALTIPPLLLVFPGGLLALASAVASRRKRP